MASIERSLELVTAPATTAVNRDEVAEEARITHHFEDARLLRAIAVATSIVESESGTQTISAVYRMRTAGFPDSVTLARKDVSWIDLDGSILIPKPPLVSVSSIIYYDSNNAAQTLATTIYDVDRYSTPGRIYLKADQEWPNTYTRNDAVSIVFVCGYVTASTVPPEVRHAILFAAVRLFEQDSADVRTMIAPLLDSVRLVNAV